MENKNIVINPHAEAREWHDKGGQVEKWSHYDNFWFIEKNPNFNQIGNKYRPYTHGLEVGMLIPEKVISAWHKLKGESMFKTHCNYQQLISDKTIQSFNIVDSKCFFTAISENYEIQLIAEGFLDFRQSFESKKEEEAPKEWPLNKWLYSETSQLKWITKLTEVENDKAFYSEYASPDDGYKNRNGSDWTSVNHIKRVAAKEDIESTFAVVLEKMGYREGVKVKRPSTYRGDSPIVKLEKSDVWYEDKVDSIWMDGTTVYCDGEFATIVQPQKNNAVMGFISEMLTHDELKDMLRVINIYNDDYNGMIRINTGEIENKLKSLIQPEPVPPVVGEVYEYEGMVGYCMDINKIGARFKYREKSESNSFDIVVSKQGWHKLTLLKPVK